MTPVSYTVNAEWQRLLRHILQYGSQCRPRNMTTKEIIGFQTDVPMSAPVITLKERNLGYKFLTAEAAWIASGDNRVSTIKPYSKMIAQFSDDGYSYFGAYGPKFVDQVSYVVEALVRDPVSRQAVINIWREKPAQTRDVPCTLSFQYFLRQSGTENQYELHCAATMRSSDAWLGWPYDVHNFSALAAFVMILLRKRFADQRVQEKLREEDRVVPEIRLGRLYLTAGSQHLYKRDWEDAQKCLASNEIAFDYKALDPTEFREPEQFIEHLKMLAKRELHYEGDQPSWLAELLSL